MKIFGHQKVISHLFDLAENSRLPHALLFTGPEGVGKRRVALHLAQRLFCKREKSPCGSCHDCERVAARTHPDLHWVEPEKEIIKIEAIRNLKADLALRPFEATHKVAVLADAHVLNPAASNALLKTLEEPPSNTLIVLITSSPYRLLKTLLSRCQKIYFSPLNEEETRRVLQDSEEGKALNPEFVRLASGSPGLALSLKQEGFELFRQNLLPALEAEPKDLLSLFSAAEDLAGEESLHRTVLHLLKLHWTEKIRKAPSLPLLKQFDALERAGLALDRYANPQLTFENLFLNLCL